MLNSKKNNRGQVLVLVAIALVVIIGFAALAIDIGYFYHTKNQLQGAADAAALAGSDRLNELVTGNTQTIPRQAAQNYAQYNSASGSPVKLMSDNTNALSDSNDITLGYWTNAYNEGGTPVNAIKVRARMTNKDMAGFPRIFGKLFSTSTQTLGATAIAVKPARSSIFFSICQDACACTYPAVSTPCTISDRNLDTNPTATTSSQFAWTSLTEVHASNNSDIKALICGAPPFVNNCGKTIYENNGTMAVYQDFASAMYNPNYESTEKEYSGTKVSGWWVIVPVTSCPVVTGDKDVLYYAKVRIKAVCTGGGPVNCTGGGGCWGNYCAQNSGPPNICNGVPNNTVVIDRILCFGCNDPIPGMRSILVQ